MRSLIVRALAVLAVPLALGGLAAMGFGLASESDEAIWVFAFGMLALVAGVLSAASALIVARPTGRWPEASGSSSGSSAAEGSSETHFPRRRWRP